MDLFFGRVWRNGAWICRCHGTPLRFSAGIGWHHYRHITMREKIGFDTDDRGYRIAA